MVYLIVCVVLRRQREPSSESAADDKFERCLSDLDEVTIFFAGSMGIEDTFRLVMSRVKELIPVEAGMLYLLVDRNVGLRPAATFTNYGSGPFDPGLSFGLADASKASQSIVFDAASGAVAFPLFSESGCVGVIQLKLKKNEPVTHASFENLGERIAPALLSSIAYEQNRSSALTDATTDLPNEKAFYLILENQIAEAQRDAGVRPLAVACVDIKNFDQINQRFGHAAGDRALNIAVQIIKDNLRKMDFFARASNDEFLIILPTASTAVTREVIARISTGFFGRKLKIGDDISTEIELNFGWATFGEDGETAVQLLTAARLRKSQYKTSASNKVLWFNREMMH